MLISKKNRLAILSYLFKEGVVCAKKDYNLPKHPEIEASNLEVIKLMTSLTSRDLVSSRFSWNYYYWFLTDEGIESDGRLAEGIRDPSAAQHLLEVTSRLARRLRVNLAHLHLPRVLDEDRRHP